MLPESRVADALEEYRGLIGLWTLATGLAVMSQLLITTWALLGTVFFLLAATAVIAASISCAYVIARDSE